MTSPDPNEDIVDFKYDDWIRSFGQPSSLIKNPLAAKIWQNMKDCTDKIRKTQYPMDFLVEVYDADNYRLMIEDLLWSINEVAQRNKVFRPKPTTGDARYEYPPQQSPYDLLYQALSVFNDSKFQAQHKGTTPAANSDKLIGITKKLADVQRQFLRRVERTTFNLRLYLIVEQTSLENAKSFLEPYRRRMDYVNHMIKKIPHTDPDYKYYKQLFETSTQAFLNQLEKVKKMLRELNEKKKLHFNDVKDFMVNYQIYHILMLKELQPDVYSGILKTNK